MKVPRVMKEYKYQLFKVFQLIFQYLNYFAQVLKLFYYKYLINAEYLNINTNI